MKKALAAFGVLSAALVLLVAPVSAQTPNDIKATITAAPANPVAGTSVNVTAVFSIPVLSATGAEVSVTSSAGPVTLVSFTPGLSSCLTTSGGVTCTWSTPDPASPQTIVISVPVTASGVTFNANAGAAGQATSKATTSVTVTQATTTTTIAGATTTAAATTTVAPPPTEAPTTTVAPTTTAAGTLPATGTNSNAPLMIAIVAIVLGAVLLGATRLVRSRS
jgi:LPXTG-motif cell wall-anchored protein